jgi:hypothetical protein
MNIHGLSGIEFAIPAFKRLQTSAVDCVVIGIGDTAFIIPNNKMLVDKCNLPR